MKLFVVLLNQSVNNQDVGGFAAGCALFRASEAWIMCLACVLGNLPVMSFKKKIFHKRRECYLNVERFSLLEKGGIVRDSSEYFP